MSPRAVTPYHLKIVSGPDDRLPSPPVVALLIPAGDPSAFERFFHRLPLSGGVSYLVMEYHGSSRGRNTAEPVESLPAMLERTTLVAVKIPGQDTLLEKDCLYLVPAGSMIEIVGGRLIFQRPPSTGGNETIVAQFLAAVATGCNGRCIAIVLPDLAARVLASLRVVRDEGGFTMVLDDQNPFSSPHPVYRSSIVDLFLTPPLAASRLAGLILHLQTARQKLRENPGGTSGLTPVYQQLFGLKGADYSRYAAEDVLRRVQRRIAVHDLPDLDAYVALLQSDEEEVTRLHEELQSVLSGFMIDPLLETALTGRMLPQLLRSGRRPEPLRIWIPHCSGSHLAYAIAVIIAEWLEEKRLNLSFQVFVTGFNNNAVAEARKGIFSGDELEQLGRGRRKKYFMRTEKDWQIVKTVRETCIFATHDLLTDPPFSHIDLLIAAGALIGLDAGDCTRAFRLFHYALNPDGYLVAGTEHRHVPPTDFFLPAQGYRGVYGRLAGPVNYWLGGPKAPPVSIEEQEADRLLLSGYVPASFLVDEQFRVIRYYGNTAAYLRNARDASSRYLFRIVRDELVFELNDLIDLVDKEDRAVTRHNIVLGDDTQEREVSLEMVPLRSFGNNWRLVIIREEAAQPVAQPEEAETGRGPSGKDLRIRQLEKELQEMRGLLLVANEDTRKTQEALQRANEELQASNEEYRSLNRELQGFNEELTTIHEGLLTRNQELSELNEGLRAHIRELRTSSDTAMAIVATMRRPIVVLREDLRIHTANQAFYHYFGLSGEQAAGQYLYALGLEVFRRDSLRLRLQQVQSQRLGVDFDLQHRCVSRGERALRCNASRIAGVTGFRSGILLSFEDVTEQYTADRLKDQLIGIASHELRTPATSIQAYSQLLSKELKDTEGGRSAQLVSKLNRQVARLAGLTRDLMDVSRITRGRIHLEEEPFDINALITETTRQVQETTAVRIDVGRLPPAQPVLGDREWIGRVLNSLLSNGVKYSRDGGRIDIHTLVTKEDVRVHIAVSGAGLPVEPMRKLFDQSFFSGDPLSIGLPNDSIGLYVSAEIVRKHGGEISLNEKGKSIVFSVVLPFEKRRVAELSVV